MTSPKANPDNEIIVDGKKIIVIENDNKISLQFEDWDPKDVEDFIARFEKMMKDKLS